MRQWTCSIISPHGANNRWSNDRLYRAVLALQPGEFEAARTSFFPSIKETLNHILAVDLLYLDMLEEGGVGAGIFDDFVPFDDAARLAAGAGGVRPSADRLLRRPVGSRSRPARHHRPARGRQDPRAHRRHPGASVPPPDPSSRTGACDAVGHLGEAAAARRVLPRLRSETAHATEVERLGLG